MITILILIIAALSIWAGFTVGAAIGIIYVVNQNVTEDKPNDHKL